MRVSIGTKASSCFKFNFIVMYDVVTDIKTSDTLLSKVKVCDHIIVVVKCVKKYIFYFKR